MAKRKIPEGQLSFPGFDDLPELEVPEVVPVSDVELLKHLFLVRHGSYISGSGDLTEGGIRQMRAMAGAIRERVAAGRTCLVSSVAKRAVNSSNVLIEELGLSDFEREEYLWSGPDVPRDLDTYWKSHDCARVMGIVQARERQADALVVVTHLEVAEDFPTYFVQQRFDPEDKGIRELEKGEGVYFDLEGKRYEIIP